MGLSSSVEEFEWLGDPPPSYRRERNPDAARR
jgi:hypothetical protein